MLEALLAAGDYQPKNAFEKIQIFVQRKLSILFSLNELLIEKAKDHTPEELAELTLQQTIIIVAVLQ